MATLDHYPAMGHRDGVVKVKYRTYTSADSEVGVLSSEKKSKCLKATLCAGWTPAKAMRIVLFDEPNIPQRYLRSRATL